MPARSTPNRKPVLRTTVALAATALAGGSLLWAGPLDPPAGPITSTFKTLTEVEPRIAVNATNTPGNFQNLFRITQPGSYYLTGNITGVSGKSAIEIASSGVTLDLMGFDLVGVSGSLNGISMNTVSVINVVIRNGSLRNWVRGVDAGIATNSRLEDLRVSGSTGIGILTGNNCTLTNCTAQSGTNRGIQASSGCRLTNCAAKSNAQVGIYAAGVSCILTGCTASQNGGTGIETLQTCTLTGCTADDNANGGIDTSNSCSVNTCTAWRNTGSGIAVGSGSSITNSSAMENTGSGINAGAGGSVTGCGAYLNGGVGIDGFAATIAHCAAYSNTGDGIRVGAGCLVRDNTCYSNGVGTGDAAGIHATAGDNRIEGNNCLNGDRGIDVDFFGNIIVRNTCSGNTVNWTIAANNVFGPIMDRTAPASAAVNGNSAPSSLGSADANANYTY